MLDGFGWPHLLIIAVLLIVLFGAKRLPGAAKGIGQSLKIFKSEVRDLQQDEAAPQPPVAPTAFVPPAAQIAPQPVAAPVAPAPMAPPQSQVHNGTQY